MKKIKINSYVEEKWKKEHPPESLPVALIKAVGYIFIAVLLFIYVVLS